MIEADLENQSGNIFNLRAELDGIETNSFNLMPGETYDLSLLCTRTGEKIDERFSLLWYQGDRSGQLTPI